MAQAERSPGRAIILGMAELKTALDVRTMIIDAARRVETEFARDKQLAPVLLRHAAVVATQVRAWMIANECSQQEKDWIKAEIEKLRVQFNLVRDAVASELKKGTSSDDNLPADGVNPG
jgi:hypothetical protein